MATKDIWGRDLGQDVSVNEMARQMSSPTKSVPLPEGSDSSVSNEKLDKLYEAINRVAGLIDSNATEQLASTQDYIREILSGSESLRQATEKGNRESIEKIDLVSQASRQLLTEFTSQNTAWVGISKLSDRAQSDIRKAFGFIDCCEQMKNVAIEMQGVRGDLKIAEQTKANLLSEQAARSAGDGGDLTKQLENTLSNQTNSRGGGGGRGGRGGRVAQSAPGSDPDMGQMFALAQLIQAGLTTATRMAAGLSDKMGINMLSVFDGLITNSDQYIKNMRVLIHEQHGFGHLNREIEKQYIDIYEHARASGVSAEKYMELQSKNLERGLGYLSEQEATQIRMSKLTAKEEKAGGKEFKVLQRRLKMLHSIQTSASNTAAMLHMSADTLNEMFMDMHYHIGLSAMEVGEMGRHMQHVAKTTGMTGAQLERAMKSAEGVIKNLKKAGVVSVEANKKVMSFMAASQKYGFEGGADMMNALSSREAFLESSQRAFLTQIARASGEQEAINDLVMGTTLQDPQGIKRLMKGTENFVKERFTQVIGPDIAESVGINLNEISPENISKVIEKLQMGDARAQQAAAVLQRQFKALGMELGEVEQMYKAQKEASKTPLDRMNDLNKQLANLKIAQGKGVDVSDEIKRVEAEIRAAQNNMNMDAIGALNTYQKELETMKKGGEAGARAEEVLLKKMTDTLGKDAGEKFVNQLKAGQKPELIGETLKTLDQRLKESGLGGVASQIATKFPDFNEFQEKLAAGDADAAEELQRVMQLQGVKDKAANDPILSLQETLRETNIYLQTLANTFRAALTLIGAWVISLTALGGSIIGAIATFTTTILSALGSLMGLRGLMGGGGMMGGSGMMGGGGGGKKGKKKGRASSKGSRKGTATPQANAPSKSSTARPKGSRGKASAKGTRTRTTRRPRVRGGRGRGSWLPMLATAGVSFAAGSWMSGGEDKEGMEDGSVPDLLTQIRDILASCCSGGGLGTGGAGIPTTEVPEDNGSYLSDDALNRMDNLAANLGMVQMGMFAVADFAGDSAKSASKAAAQSADDVARAAAQSVDDVAKAAINNTDVVARSAVSNLDDAVRAANTAATVSKAGAQSGVAAAAGGAGGAVPKAPSVPSAAGGAVPKAPSVPSAAGGAVPKAPSVPSAAGGAVPKLPAAKGFLGRMSDSLSSAWKSTKTAVGNAAGSVKGTAGSLWQSAGNAVESAKGAASSAWTSTTGAVSDAYGSAKGFVGKGVDKLKSGVATAGDYMRMAGDKMYLNHVKEFLSKHIGKILPNFLKSGGGMVGSGLLNIVKGAAKFAGPIAGVLELAFAGMDVYEAANQKGVPVEDLEKEIGKIIISQGLGFLAGTLLSGGLASLLTPIPGGTFVGGLLGYIAGDWIGRTIGDIIADYVGGPSLGKMIFGLGSSWGWWPDKASRESDIAAAQNPTGMPDASQVPIEAPDASDVALGMPDAKMVDNPLMSAEVGAREILQAGVAQLHEGEVVVPKDVWEKIKAVGAGPFTGAANILSAIKHSYKDSDKPDMNLHESLGMKRKMSMMGLLSPLFLGAFDKKSTVEAGEEQTNFMLRKVNSKESPDQDGLNFEEKSLSLLEKLVHMTGLSLGVNKKENKETEETSVYEFFEKFKSNIASKLLDASSVLGLDKVFSSVSNLGLFDKEKTSEAQDVVSESVSKSMELSSKFNPDNYKGTMIDPMSGVYTPTMSEALGGSITEINKKVMAKMQEAGLFDPDKKEEAADVEKQSFLNQVSAGMASTLGIGGATGPIEGILQKVIQSVAGSKSVTNPTNLGLFDPDKKEEAQDVEKQSFLNQVSAGMASTLGIGGATGPIGDTLQKVFESISEKTKSIAKFASLGLFDPDKKEETADVEKQNFLGKMGALNLNDIAILEIEKYLSKKSKSEKNIVADVNDSLNYGTEASDSASRVFGDNSGIIDSGIVPSTMDYSDDLRGTANTSIMDYSDDIKGEVGTLGLSRFAVESAIEQRKYGETAKNNTAILPSMDDVADYLLVDQKDRLDQMISLLDAIKNNTARSESMLGADIIGSIASDAAPGASSGIKNAARDMNRGLWDLTYSDYSSSTITTDGRGGIG